MEFLNIKSQVIINIDDIKDVQGLEYAGDPDDDLSGKYIVRVYSRTPFTDFICDDLNEAKYLYKNIQKSRKIVNIDEMR